MPDLTFHPTLVVPFYGHLMNGNIVTLTPSEERVRLWCEFREVMRTVSDDMLVAMLRSSWRPAKVAAWAIADRGRHGLLPEVARQLKQSPDHAEHLCICLARLGGEEALVALLGYAEACAGVQLAGVLDSDRLSTTWARCALRYLDAPDAGELFARFVDGQPEKFRLHWSQHMERTAGTFALVMALFDSDASRCAAIPEVPAG